MIHFDISKLEEDYRDFETQTFEEDFWNDSKKAKLILDNMKNLKCKIETFTCLSQKIVDSLEFLKILSDEEFENQVINGPLKFINSTLQTG